MGVGFGGGERQGLVEEGQIVGAVVVADGRTGCKSRWSSKWWRGGDDDGETPWPSAGSERAVAEQEGLGVGLRL